MTWIVVQEDGSKRGVFVVGEKRFPRYVRRVLRVEPTLTTHGSTRWVYEWLTDLTMTTIGTPDIPELRAAFLMSCHLNGVTDGAEDAFNRWLADIRAEAWDEGYSAGGDDEAFNSRGLSSDPNADECPHENPYRRGNE